VSRAVPNALDVVVDLLFSFIVSIGPSDYRPGLFRPDLLGPSACRGANPKLGAVGLALMSAPYRVKTGLRQRKIRVSQVRPVATQIVLFFTCLRKYIHFTGPPPIVARPGYTPAYWVPRVQSGRLGCYSVCQDRMNNRVSYICYNTCK
jgi:hypothetical protein